MATLATHQSWTWSELTDKLTPSPALIKQLMTKMIHEHQDAEPGPHQPQPGERGKRGSLEHEGACGCRGG